MDFVDMDRIHEECGVFGIYAPAGTEVGRDIYYGLMALQHRGQESAGISISDTMALRAISPPRRAWAL